MRDLLSVEQYAAELLALISTPTAAETVAVTEAIGRTLAAPVTARISVPAFDNSAMDGYALRFADAAAGPLLVIGEVPAGSPDDPALGPGECVRIMTGAPLPTSADTVVPIEHTDGDREVVTLTVLPAARGQHVRRRGDDLAAGDELLAAGTRVTPAALAAIAGAGRGRVSVRRAPVVAVAATGDELVGPDAVLGRGQIVESNSLQLKASLERDGARVRRLPVIADRLDAFAAALDAVDGVDLIVLSGGVSVGDFDVVRDGLTELGEGRFVHVRMQPGKPQGYGRWRGHTPVIALPGNPLSTALSYEVFVAPVIAALLGRDAPRGATGVAEAGWRSPAGRRQFVPVAAATDGNGALRVRPTHRRGSASHMITSLLGATHLAVVPEDVTEVAPGDALALLPLP